MCSSIGRLSDSVTERPRWISWKRSMPGAASSGRYRLIASGRASVSFAICSMCGTAARAGNSSRYPAGNAWPNWR